MDPATHVSILWALAALPILAFLPLVLITLLAPLRTRERERR